MEPQRAPPERNGNPNLLANWPAPYRILLASGVPKVGAPEFISIDVTNAPNITGAPGFNNWEYATPDKTSAKTWTKVPATDTGDIAPPTIKGEIIQAWLEVAYSSNAPIIIESKVRGELILIKLVNTVFCLTNSSPKRIFTISTLSLALSGAVTEPINGLSE